MFYLTKELISVLAISQNINNKHTSTPISKTKFKKGLHYVVKFQT